MYIQSACIFAGALSFLEGKHLMIIIKGRVIIGKKCIVYSGISEKRTQKICLGKENPKKTKEMQNMSTNNSNHLVNPAAREAMDKFKMEAASEVGVNLKNGYNGDLTSRQAGSVGGQMVKKMIEAYENGMK